MLKKYTKYAATALAVASLSTFIIGCAEGEEEVTGSDTSGEMPGPPEAGPGDNTEEMPESKIMTIPLAYIHTALETRIHNVIPPDPSTI